MYKDSQQRNYELCEIFDIIYKNRRNEGLSHKESRSAAFDAIDLLFGLSKTRTRNIINEMRKVNSNELMDYPFRFKERIDQLLKLLNEVKINII